MKHWQRNLLSILIVLIAIVVHMSITRWGWGWTGMVDYVGPKTQDGQEYFRGKTLWDWLELLIVPVALALVALWFSTRERKDDREAAEERAKTDRDIATDRMQEAALQVYYDKLTELLLVNNLREASEGDEVIQIARSRTLVTLRSLDGARKGLLIRFLAEAKLIEKEHPIIRLEDADLRQANLSYANLSGVDLSGANLREVKMFHTKLQNANLCKTDMDKAELFGADLRQANLCGAYMDGANFVVAKLEGADLRNVDLKGANLQGADLSGTDLENASLYKAKLEDQQIANVRSLKNISMPDGRHYDPAVHTEIARLRKEAGLDKYDKKADSIEKDGGA